MIVTSRLPLRVTDVVVTELVVEDKKVLRDNVVFPVVIIEPFAGKAVVVWVGGDVVEPEDWAKT